MLPRRPRAGLYLDDGAIGFAVVDGTRVTHFRCRADEEPGAAVKSELESRQLRVRHARIGLRRGRVLVKALELPAASARGDVAEMLGFELERHVPFAPEEMAWSWSPLPGPKGGAVRVLAVAAERRAVDQSLRILEESRLRPLSVTVACHDLLALLARRARPARAIWAHRAGPATDLLVLGGGRIQLSRTVTAPDPGALAGEVAATAGVLRWPAWDALWISGDDAPRFLEAPEIAPAGVSATPPPWTPEVASMVAGLPGEGAGAALLALAVALGARRPDLDLLPAELRPRRVTAGQLLTATTATVAVGLAIALFWTEARRDQRYLERLGRATRALDADVREVERVRAETAQRTRLLRAILDAEQNALRPLPFLRELTEAIPQDAWISALNVDGRGVDVTGQAGAANQLIPILEETRWLERVEFTSPVTRGRDREQFRLRAAWEAGPRGPADRSRVDVRPETSRGPAPPVTAAPPAARVGPRPPIDGAPAPEASGPRLRGASPDAERPSEPPTSGDAPADAEPAAPETAPDEGAGRR